ncbi:hypothetical protein Ahy_B09g099049 [Arachis hypogaea]|uniref:Replication protein A 70 kDa DNA-binding subunit B/D first OB fold domain-containing protein n=1 Tax=Arachis hypogaea TaxID=3818 RepID=A0A444XTL8_ARAHY|nr:hypothetical protein Ahy_B09g099049 [Arachis hypogaea]
MITAPPSSTEISASLLGSGHMQRSYGYLCDLIRSQHEGVVLFVVSVPSLQGCSISFCGAYLILHLDFSVLDSRCCHRGSRVVRLWYHKNPALDPSQNLLHMVLMDEKLHKIQATIRDQLISKFALSLNEGDVYLMTHFTVVPNTGLNRVTKHRFRLLFQYNTSIVSVVSPRIPHSGLCFASIDEIDQMTKDHNFLIDFVGIITGVRKERDVASYGKLVKAVVLEVFADGKRVQCNVFGNACDLLEYDKLQKYARSPLVVLESFKIKAIEGGVILKNVINVSRLFINPDIPESVEFLSRFSVARYRFSRLMTNDLGYLVSKVDGDYFNPKEISNIQDLHSDNGDSHYFVIGTIKEVMDEPDWWYYTCVCGHAVVEHEDLYLCDACGSCVEHVMVKYGIRVKIQAARCTVLFVLLDNAATKLFGRTCSEAFLRIEEEFPVDPSVLAVCRSYSPQMFDYVVGEEKVFKVEIDSAVDPDYSSCFKIVNVFSHNPEPVAADDYINAMLHGPIFPPIYDSYLQYATGEDYKIQVVCDNAIQSETIEDIITDLISPNRCYSNAENGSYCKVVPLKLISSLFHKKVIFMVDARPVGYEMNRSVYIVQQIWDDASVINVFEVAAEMNDQKIHVLVDSMPEVEDAFSQCESDHKAVEDLHAFYCCHSRVVKERTDSSGKHARDYTVYTGALGTHHKIQATVEDDLIGTFIDQSKEGKVFIISEFKVIPNRGLVRVTRHRFRIIFKCSTSVVAAASTLIPNPGLSKCVDYEYLIDFVGVLCGLKKRRDVECNGKILKVLTLEVFADGKKISCNFVGDCPALIDMNTLKRYQRPPVVILQYFKIKVNGGEELSMLHMSHNEVGDLVCVIDDESFDWKLIRTIDNLKANNEDGQFFVVGKIKEIVEDPEWWFFSCVCGHPIVGDDNVFHCQLCSREVQHFMIRLILIEDGTSLGIFVLLDSPATKLLGRTCSDVFLLLEDEIDDVSSDSGFSPIFEDFSRYGQLRSYENQVISGVPIQLHSIKEMLADILCAKIYSSASRNDQICFLIGEIIDVLKHQKWWYYCCLCNAPVSHVGNVFYCYLCRVECVDAIRRYRIKIIVSHSNGSNIFILEDDESTDDYTIPNGMISQLMNKKIVFIVDPRHVGYELNTSLHVVYAVCDDVEIVKFLEDSSHDNQQQMHKEGVSPL